MPDPPAATDDAAAPGVDAPPAEPADEGHTELFVVPDPIAREKAEQQAVGYSLVVVILIVGVLGAWMISMLLKAWRRYNQRQNRPPRRGSQPVPDAWAASAQRLTADQYHDPDEEENQSEDEIEGFDPDSSDDDDADGDEDDGDADGGNGHGRKR